MQLWGCCQNIHLHILTHRVRRESSSFQEKRHQDIAEPLDKWKWDCAGVPIRGGNTCRVPMVCKDNWLQQRKQKSMQLATAVKGNCLSTDLLDILECPSASYSLCIQHNRSFLRPSLVKQWQFSVKGSYFPLLPILPLKLSRPCSLGFPKFLLLLTSSFLSYGKSNFSLAIWLMRWVHSCIL